MTKLVRNHPMVASLALAAVFVAASVLVMLPAWSDIAFIASVDEEASHIMLVPLVAVWLVWVRRVRLRRCAPAPSMLGPVLVLAGWVTSAFGFRNGAQSLFHGGAVLMAVGAIVTVIGRDFLSRFAPAFAVLVFMVPIPGRVRQAVAIPMQTATAHVTQAVFDVLGEPVERSGNQLSINGKPVAIAEACNGMRMVFALFLVSYAFAFGEPLRGGIRLLIIGASPLSAILCNVIRMVPTVYLYGHASESMASGFHDLAGWVMLVIAFLLLTGIVRVLRWAMIPVLPYTLATA